MVAMMVLLISARLAEQSTVAIVGVLAVIGVGALIVVAGWQQLQIRRLQHQIHLLHGQIQRSVPRRTPKPEPTVVSHFDAEHFFRQGQTKH
jgi:hypothetical protein